MTDALSLEQIAEQLRRRLEDELIARRDARISVLGCGNGLVCRERDGRASSVIRMSTSEAIELILSALRAAEARGRQLEEDANPESLSSELSTLRAQVVRADELLGACRPEPHFSHICARGTACCPVKHPSVARLGRAEASALREAAEELCEAAFDYHVHSELHPNVVGVEKTVRLLNARHAMQRLLADTKERQDGA